MATYPAAIDNSFPGYPYTDNIEYILGEYLNATVTVLQAVENTIGAGTGSTPSNPLYSPVFRETFSTVTARILNAEELTAANTFTIDSSAGDIAPVGKTAEAGETGKLPDAGHAHVGVHTVNGQTGDVTIEVQDISNYVYNVTGEIMCGTGQSSGQCLPPQQNKCVLKCDDTDPCGVSWAVPGECTYDCGDIKHTACGSPPGSWLPCDGRAVPRTTWPDLLTAITVSSTCVCSTSSFVLTSVPSAIIAQVLLGGPIECPGYLQSGCVVTATTTTTITVSIKPIQGGACTWRHFPCGNGDGATTFNCPNVPSPSVSTKYWCHT